MRLHVLGAVLIAVSAIAARGFTIDAGGTVMSSATAGTSIPQNQTDSETFTLPAVLTSASQGPPLLLPHADASQAISFDALATVLSIAGQVHATKPPYNGSNFLDTASAKDQGDLTLTLSQAQTIVGSLSIDGHSGIPVSVTLDTLDDSQQLLSLSLSDPGSVMQSVTLPAAQYKLHWATTAQVGGINPPLQQSRTFQIQVVPEPGSVALVIFPILLALRRRAALH